MHVLHQAWEVWELLGRGLEVVVAVWVDDIVGRGGRALVKVLTGKKREIQEERESMCVRERERMRETRTYLDAQVESILTAPNCVKCA